MSDTTPLAKRGKNASSRSNVCVCACIDWQGNAPVGSRKKKGFPQNSNPLPGLVRGWEDQGSEGWRGKIITKRYQCSNSIVINQTVRTKLMIRRDYKKERRRIRNRLAVRTITVRGFTIKYAVLTWGPWSAIRTTYFNRSDKSLTGEKSCSRTSVGCP